MSKKKKTFLLIVTVILCYALITYGLVLINLIRSYQVHTAAEIVTDYFIIEDSHLVPLNTSQNIFFIESSEPSSLALIISPRQACAIESASTQNPDSQIFVYLSKIVGVSFTPTNNGLWKVIQALPNVHVKLINSTEFTMKTPVEHLLRKGLNSKVDWQKYHKSDILRFVLLWKYPGTYLDFDLISMKPLNVLGTNFAVIQAATTDNPTIQAGAGIVNFDKNATGRKLAEIVVKSLSNSFDGRQWDASSVGVLSRSIENLCETTKLSEMTPERCKGFHLYPQKLFYAIDYTNFTYFFQEQYFEEAMKALDGSLGSHIWNYLSHGVAVKKVQKVVLTELAKTYCPRVFAAPGEYF